MIKLVKVCKSFKSQKVLDNLDFEIEPEKITVIIGRSGGGKSVLLKHMIGLIRPDSGQVFVDGIGNVIFIKKPKVKNINIRLYADGGVKATLPVFSSYSQAIKVVRNKIPWILKQRKKLKKRERKQQIIINSDTVFPYLKHKIELIPYETTRGQIRIYNGTLKIFYPEGINIEDKRIQDFIRMGITEAMRIEAKNFLPQRVEELAGKYGFSYRKVFIKKAKTLWGSCSSKNNINLNLHLMRLPERLQDYIIIHESGHEWFANSITNVDIADMWIHEGFTTYSEVLYLDYHFGNEAGNAYAVGIRKNIKNDKPVIGIYNVNKTGSLDMYPKAAVMIHTLRQMINDDEKFRQILRGMNQRFYHQTVTTQQIEEYLSNESNMNLSTFFDQYLRTVEIPVLEYIIDKKVIRFRFINTVKNFNIPVKIYVNNQEKWINPTNEWQKLKTSSINSTFRIDQNFYIESIKKD